MKESRNKQKTRWCYLSNLDIFCVGCYWFNWVWLYGSYIDRRQRRVFVFSKFISRFAYTYV